MKSRILGALSVAVLSACSVGVTSASTSTVESTDTITDRSRVVRVESLGAPEGAVAWTVEYTSETVLGEPTTVTAWVAVPETGAGPLPVLAWAHPTVGLADECSPSLRGGLTPFSFDEELTAGWAVVATDYEGLGGPGLHPYLVSESEARSIFDLVRAASELDDRVGSRLALWGFSQGGHAVLSAAGLASELAPDLEILGTAAVAPAVDLIGWSPEALGTPQQGYIAMIMVAFAAAYGLDVDEVLAPLDRDLLHEIESNCGDPSWLGAAVLAQDDVFVTDPASVEPWATLLRENSPEFTTIDAPVLLVVGEDDRLFPLELLSVVVDRMCTAGTPVRVLTYPDTGHTAATTASNADVRAFLAERLDGAAFTADCA